MLAKLPIPEPPTTPEEITREWLSHILSKSVRSFEITGHQLLETAGKVFVLVNFEDGSKGKICLKGGFNPYMLNMPGYGNILRSMYQREAEAYELMCDELKFVERVPQFKLPKFWGSAHSVIALDNLKETCTFGNARDAWSQDLVKQGIKQLAMLHGGTWGFNNPRFWPAYQRVMLALAAPEKWDKVVLGEDRPKVPEVFRNRNRVVSAMAKHFMIQNPKFQCLIHADPHHGNTYLDKETGEPGFLDYQTAYSGSALHDVAYFMVGALSIEDRRAAEMEMLDYYLAQLARYGGPQFAREEVLEEYKRSTMAGMGWILTPYDMQPKDHVYPMVQRYVAAMQDHNTIELVENLSLPDDLFLRISDMLSLT
ncbi:kinase-like domain-containing protein [Xylariales sp. PMI_506]|nr:kinase-like domain-containing protein [Xylariales sp. PMI_506]